ncbi:hypothetical protein [Bacillus sp. RIT 809]|uniref:hypothetical protein n=1 Tax=Bacillus sp. RIT 809 TaxID=2803857 RepID=UPI0019516F7A|nr:hypothetical protein [Bacillus sp. RIT 809]MBM6647066.1 hypothetical protein [Bacillus sp. RIT 809]
MNIYNDVKKLLEKKKYKVAFEKFKEYIEKSIEDNNFSSESFKMELKGKRILINMTSDKKINKLFCSPLIKLLREKEIQNLQNYLLQCTYINNQFETLISNLDDLCDKLKNNNQTIALYKILNAFENLNHQIVSQKIDNPYNISEHIGMQREALYQNVIEALNMVLERWHNMSLNKEFNKKNFKEKDIVRLKPLSMDEDIWKTFINLNFLYWLSDEMYLNDMEIKDGKDFTEFQYIDPIEFIRYNLPSMRENSLNRKFTIELAQDNLYKDEIDYENVMGLKFEGEHFYLKLDLLEDVYDHLINSVNAGEIETVKIAKLLRVRKLSEIRYNDVNLREAFIFYMCIRNFADIYYNATEYYIDKYKKKPKCPFLSISIKALYWQYELLLSKVLGRKLTISDFEKWIDFFTFGKDKVFDLYYKPLVRNGDSVVIIPSLFLANNVYMTFIKHLQLLQIDMSSKGLIFEEENRNLLQKANLKVYNADYNFNYNSAQKKGNVKGDIDVIAWDEKYLFLAEVKNHLDPIDLNDYRGANKVLKKAHSQIEKILMYVKEEKKEFCETIGMSEEEFAGVKIVPFIIISGHYRSGEKYGDVQIVDYNSLEKFIVDGSLRIESNVKTLVEISLREEINSQELKNYLDVPYYYGLEGCYGPRFYRRNVAYMPRGMLVVSPNLPELDMESHKYKELFPNEEKVKELLESNQE